MVIAHFDWLPLAGNVVEATERLILQHNPRWNAAGGSGLHPRCLADLAGAGFERLETFSFDQAVAYSHEAWRGRIRASAGVAASLEGAAVARFDAEHAALLARDFPDDPLQVPHRCWAAIGSQAVGPIFRGRRACLPIASGRRARVTSMQLRGDRSPRQRALSPRIWPRHHGETRVAGTIGRPIRGAGRAAAGGG